MKTFTGKGIGTSVLLIILGVAGYVLGGFVSVTALIPAFFGIPILIASVVASKNEKVGKWIATVFAFLGAVAPLGRLIPVTIKGKFAWGLPAITQILMIVICAVFFVLCLQSLKKAPSADA